MQTLVPVKKIIQWSVAIMSSNMVSQFSRSSELFGPSPCERASCRKDIKITCSNDSCQISSEFYLTFLLRFLSMISNPENDTSLLSHPRS